MLLRRRRFRNKPTAFWCIGTESIEVAVIGNSIGEPILLSCAAVESRSIGSGIAYGAGLAELVSSLDARLLPHIAALAEPLCRISTDVSEAGGRILAIAGDDSELHCDADAAAARAVAANFRWLGLQLGALDCGPCARLNLARFLGESTGTSRVDRDLDPLAAVAVAPEIEADAIAMGSRLAVPVGLALGHLGWLRDA